MSTVVPSDNVNEGSTLCSIDQCATPFDVHCFHCRTNMCSNHYFEHKQKNLSSDNDDAMNDLLELASSKWFCISGAGSAITKIRRTFSNPFVSSGYLLKKMRQRAARSSNSKKTNIAPKPKNIIIYNLRKRPGQRTKKLVTTTVPTSGMKLCRTIVKTRLRTNRLCNRKLPCPYHTSSTEEN